MRQQKMSVADIELTVLMPLKCKIFFENNMKIEHLLPRTKCFIFHYIFKTIEMQKIYFGKYLKI